MADPVETLEAPAELPEKPFYQSQSFWAAVVAVVTGLAQQNDGLKEVAAFLQVNSDKLIGWVVTGIGFWAGFAALTRKTVLTKGK